MGAAPLVPCNFKVRSKVWVRYLRVIEGHPEGDNMGWPLKAMGSL